MYEVREIVTKANTEIVDESDTTNNAVHSAFHGRVKTQNDRTIDG